MPFCILPSMPPHILPKAQNGACSLSAPPRQYTGLHDDVVGITWTTQGDYFVACSKASLGALPGGCWGPLAFSLPCPWCPAGSNHALWKDRTARIFSTQPQALPSHHLSIHTTTATILPHHLTYMPPHYPYRHIIHTATSSDMVCRRVSCLSPSPGIGRPWYEGLGQGRGRGAGG